MITEIPVFEFEQYTHYGENKATTEVMIYRDELGLTVDAMIMVEYNPLQRNQVEQCVVSVMPDSEGVRLRDYLLSVYPLDKTNNE